MVKVPGNGSDIRVKQLPGIFVTITFNAQDVPFDCQQQAQDMYFYRSQVNVSYL
jgi:hypothetical protein